MFSDKITINLMDQLLSVNPRFVYANYLKIHLLLCIAAYNRMIFQFRSTDTRQIIDKPRCCDLDMQLHDCSAT